MNSLLDKQLDSPLKRQSAPPSERSSPCEGAPSAMGPCEGAPSAMGPSMSRLRGAVPLRSQIAHTASMPTAPSRVGSGSLDAAQRLKQQQNHPNASKRGVQRHSGSATGAVQSHQPFAVHQTVSKSTDESNAAASADAAGASATVNINILPAIASPCGQTLGKARGGLLKLFSKTKH